MWAWRCARGKDVVDERRWKGSRVEENRVLGIFRVSFVLMIVSKLILTGSWN
jgi:hypothetical protein